MELTGKQAKYLRGLGHGLRATILIGKGGLGVSVIGQIEQGLAAHELVKVKVLQNCPMDKTECARAIGVATGAALAQTLGHTLLFYKAHPERPVLELPG